MNTFFTFCILIATIGLLVYGHEYFLHIYFERVPKSYLIEYIKFDRYQFHTESSLLLALRIPYSGLCAACACRVIARGDYDFMSVASIQ